MNKNDLSEVKGSIKKSDLYNFFKELDNIRERVKKATRCHSESKTGLANIKKYRTGHQPIINHFKFNQNRDSRQNISYKKNLSTFGRNALDNSNSL